MKDSLISYWFKTISIITVIFISNAVIAESPIDSLESKLQTAHGKEKVEILYELFYKYRNVDVEIGKGYSEEAISLAEQINDTLGLGNSLNTLAIYYRIKGEYDKALELNNKALSLRITIKDSIGLGKSLNNLGLVHDYMGDYSQALDYYLKALNVWEELYSTYQEDIYQIGVVNTYNNIGVSYWYLGNYDYSMTYYLKALKIYENKGDSIGVASMGMNIGNYYLLKEDYPTALKYYLNSLKYQKQTNNKEWLSNLYTNIGIVHFKQGQIQRALEFIFRSLELSEEIGSIYSIGSSYNNLGDIYSSMKNHEKALYYLEEGLQIAKEINSKHLLRNGYKGMAEAYERKSDYKNALKYNRLYTIIKDSIFNEDNSLRVANVQEKYKSERQSKEIDMLKKQRKIKEMEEKKGKFVQYSVIGMVGFSLMIALLFYHLYNKRRKTNQTLELQNEEVYQQKLVIEENNKKVLYNMRYALKIQQASLPPMENLRGLFPDSFILYKSKEIISGDFYWFTQIENPMNTSAPNHMILAACDCTGHGVPGACMSMIGNDLLNQIVMEKTIYEPAQILNELHKGTTRILRQEEEFEGIMDGMDVAICKIDFTNYKSKSKLDVEFAGAKRPLYAVTEEGILEIKPDKMGIGGEISVERNFTNKRLELQKGDAFYLFSDGFTDQLGGDKRKTYKSKRFREFLLSMSGIPMEDQQVKLEKELAEWMGDEPQTDDILVIGVRL